LPQTSAPDASVTKF